MQSEHRLGGLILENFKAFREPQRIPMAPITLIFGPNSAGKSSIIQSLLLLKQSQASRNRSNELVQPRGNLVDLGSYADFVYDHDETRVCEISPLFSFQRAPVGIWHLIWERVGSPEVPFGLGFRFGFDAGQQQIKLQSLPAYFGSESPYAFEGTPPPSERDHPEWIFWPYDPRELTWVKLGELNDQHPLWSSLFQQFMAELSEAQWLIPEIERAIERYRSDDDEYPGTDYEEIGTVHRWMDAPAIRPTFEWQNDEDLSKFASEMVSRLKGYTFDAFIWDVRRTAPSVEMPFAQLESVPAPGEPMLEPASAVASLSMFNNQPDWELDPFASSRLPRLIDLTERSSSMLRNWLHSVIYLGPQRKYPDRHSLVTGKHPTEVGTSGESTLDILVREPEALNQANRYLKSFGMGYELSVDRVRFEPSVQEHRAATESVGGAGDLFIVRLVDTRTSTNTVVEVRDVGFGVSQVLPLIVQCCIGRNKTILVEQPELHLHPRLQAHLGSLFKDAIASPRNHQVIVETHSQHLILRLQRYIREGTLKRDDVSVVYVERGVDASYCVPLEMDERGDFVTDWPSGFFDEAYNELFGRTQLPDDEDFTR